MICDCDMQFNHNNHARTCPRFHRPMNTDQEYLIKKLQIEEAWWRHVERIGNEPVPQWFIDEMMRMYGINHGDTTDDFEERPYCFDELKV